MANGIDNKPVIVNNENMTHSGITDSNKDSHISDHDKLQSNSIKNFFSDKVKLKSFDTETTGLDTVSKDFNKRSRIYQLGLATEGIDGVESHVNPFFLFDKGKPVEEKVHPTQLENRFKYSNGMFSEIAAIKGNYKPFIQEYSKNLGNLPSLNETMNSMFSNIQSKDVLLFQNMNFENQILKSSVEQGLLTRENYESVANRMYTTSINNQGNTLFLFERPFEVQEKVREADRIFNTEFLFNRSEESFQQYRSLLNQSLEAYDKIINNPNREGAVAVELMDITKTFMANAANAGYIDKESSTLGLNMDFLMRSLFDRPEKHTALDDATETINVYNELRAANSEIVAENVSDKTKSLLEKIKLAQPEEVNRRFISTVRSVLSDFEQSGSTKLSDRYSWYTPESRLRERNVAEPKILNEVFTKKRERTYDVKEALGNVLERYSTYNNNLNGFDRTQYIDNVMKSGRFDNDYSGMYKTVDNDYFTKLVGKSTTQDTSLFNGPLVSPKSAIADTADKIPKKFLNKKTLGIAGVGLAFMGIQGRPEPIEKNYDNVSQQFYDDQYLGTAFVDFRERNKHYMM